MRGAPYCTLLCGLLVATGAAAQAPGPDAPAAAPFSAQRLRPVPDSATGFVATQRGRTVGAEALNAGVAFNYARNPLVLESTSGIDPGYTPVSGKLLTSQSTLHLLMVAGPTQWLELGFDLPIVVQQAGDALAGLPDPNPVSGKAGLGGIRLVPRAMVLDTRSPANDYPIAISVGLDTTLPTGAGTRYQGGQAELLPLLAMEIATPDDLRLAANAGYGFRPSERELLGVTADSAPAWAIGLSAPAGKYLRVSGEVARNLSTEAHLGATFGYEQLRVSGSVGIGLRGDALTPDHRIFVRVAYLVAESASLVWRDKDGDSVPDWKDECPTQKEDLDGFSDTDGCPDTVRDYIESMPH